MLGRFLDKLSNGPVAWEVLSVAGFGHEFDVGLVRNVFNYGLAFYSESFVYILISGLEIHRSVVRLIWLIITVDITFSTLWFELISISGVVHGFWVQGLLFAWTFASSTGT